MMFKKTLLAAAMIAFGGFAASSSAIAATATGSFKVNITILATCNVSAAVGTNDINLGSQNANATANLDQAQGTPITVACSSGTPYVINLTPQSTTSTTGAGNMVNGGVNVPYQLRQATGLAAAVWGNTGTVVGGVVTLGNAVQGSGTGMGNTKPYTVYATVPSTDFAPNTYSDTVNVSVAY
jgi:spore coat protein U-like protein